MIKMRISNEIQDWLGELDNIISVHGLLGADMGFALATGLTTSDDLFKLQSDMDALGEEISKYHAQAAWVF
jgi:hypothetical protein